MGWFSSQSANTATNVTAYEFANSSITTTTSNGSSNSSFTRLINNTSNSSTNISNIFNNSSSSNDTCFVVCDSNLTEALASTNSNSDAVRLKFLTGTFGAWFEPIAQSFEELKNGGVIVDIVSVDFSQLYPDIINEAISQTGLYDGFVTPPSVAGSVVQYDGWADLTSYIQESGVNSADWSDILLGYRQYIAQYENKVIMYPLDGDLLSMYYRPDILEAFKLTVPRTWDEYGQVAAATHGQVYGNQTLVGSCVGWAPNCAGAYWSNLLISSITQYEGQWSGHLFDTANMNPLAGPAMDQALQWLETQVMYGPDDQFDGCITPINSNYMNGGSCVLSYNWGNMFKNYLKEGSVLNGGKLGVAPTPGSRQVLNRKTGQLVDCTEELCKYGTTYPDIGRVNAAPYLAFGGWGCAVNNYATDSRKKRLATELCAYASSKRESMGYIIPNATEGSKNGQDPYRYSHLDLDDYVSQGYEKGPTELFISSIKDGIGSRNVVTDIRFPTSTQLNQVLENEFHNYLNATKLGYVADADRASARAAVINSIVTQWKDIIKAYDTEGTTQVPILETYQRLRGVYVKNIDLNQLGGIRWLGFGLAGLAMTLSVVFAFWTIRNRRTPVVRASQPIFLVMICVGTFVFAASIIPIGIDDQIVEPSGCDAACMAIPWLLTNGWIILFSALYAKLRRVNLVYKNSREFKRLKVSEKDVLLPFALTFLWNLVFLLVWTITDPMVWKRVPTGPLSSKGSCTFGSDSNIWKVCVAFLGVTVGVTIILANVEAYKARHVSTEYGESRYIALAMVSILQICLVGLPLLFLVDNNPKAEFFVETCVAFITSMSILLLIFAPKIYTWWTKPTERQNTVRVSGVSGVGLAFRVVDDSGWKEAHDKQIKSYQRKIDDLALLMQAEGIDADQLLRKAGLSQSPSDDNLAIVDNFSSDQDLLRESASTGPTTTSPEMSMSLVPEVHDTEEMKSMRRDLTSEALSSIAETDARGAVPEEKEDEREETTVSNHRDGP